MSHAYALIVRRPGEEIEKLMNRWSWRHKDGFWRSWCIGGGRCAGSLNLKEGTRAVPKAFYSSFVWKEKDISIFLSKNTKKSCNV